MGRHFHVICLIFWLTTLFPSNFGQSIDLPRENLVITNEISSNNIGNTLLNSPLPNKPITKKGSLTTLFQTHEGTLKGKIITVPGGEEVTVFMGVPYAEPPLGSLRFQEPKAPKPYDGEVRMATELPPTCYQYQPVTKQILGSEDCLYLNIYVPKSHDANATENEKFAVMVYIHGGFFLAGSGNYYPAYVLAARFHVIVITVNYRLGVLGFLGQTNTSTACGNCGIHDQIAALTWIKDNIANIGGDPDRITIFGQGSGATSVKLLLTIPHARGLFDAAIAQGGSIASLEEARNSKVFDPIDYVSRELQCPDNENIDHKKMVECLQKMPVQKIIDVAGKFCALDDHDYLNHPFQPYLEDLTGEKAVGQNFEEAMKKIPYNSDAVLVCGINSAEGALPYYPPLLPANTYNINGNEFTLNKETFENRIVPHILHSQNYPIDEIPMKKAATFLYTPWSDPNNESKIASSAIQMVGDQLFTVPYMKDLKYFAKSHRKLYAYLWDYETKTEDAPEHARIPWFPNAASRGSELVYVFGFPMTNRSFLEKTPHAKILNEMQGFEKDYNYQIPDVLMSEFMMETWTNIAKHRKPLLRNTVWPRVRANDLKHVVIKDMEASGPVLGTRNNFKAMQSFFWDKFYPDLEKQIQRKEISTLKEATKETTRCMKYRRALWGILGLLSIIGIFWAILHLIRMLARRRRKKYSTPLNPNL